MPKFCPDCKVYDGDDCADCDGTGEVEDILYPHRCSYCHGTGRVDYWTCANKDCWNYEAEFREDESDIAAL